MNICKNFKFVSLTNISYIEKYLKEIVNLCFEYSSIFSLDYDLNSLKTTPLYNINIKPYDMSNMIYLLNLYLEKDYFYSNLFVMINLKAKLKSNQLFQIINIKGVSTLNGSDNFLLSNLYYGLNLKDIIYSSFSSRSSIIDSSLNTSESGYLTRKLVESLRDLYIKCSICCTKYTYKNVNKNSYINTPFLCFNNKSVCLKCMSVNYSDISISGYSKGVVCGQALGEPSTQMLLRTFHLGDRLTFKNLLNSINSNCTHSNKFKFKYYYKLLINKNIHSIKKLSHTILYKYNIINIYYIINNVFTVLSFIKILNNLWSFTNLFKKYKNSYTFNNNFNIDNNIYSLI